MLENTDARRKISETAVAVAAAREKAKVNGRGAEVRPTIHVEAGKLNVLTTKAEDVLIAASLPIYQRGRSLVRPATQEVSVSHGRRTIAACFSEITQPAALDFLSRAADWSRFDGRVKADVPINPPRQIADVLLSRFGDWKLDARDIPARTFPKLPEFEGQKRRATALVFGAGAQGARHGVQEGAAPTGRLDCPSPGRRAASPRATHSWDIHRQDRACVPGYPNSAEAPLKPRGVR